MAEVEPEDPRRIRPGDNWFLRSVKWLRHFRHQPTAEYARQVAGPLVSFALACISIGTALCGVLWDGFHWVAVFIAILIAVVRIRFVAHRVTRNPPEITLPLLLTLLGIVEILVVFAVIYHGRPNALSGPPGATQTFQTALYFSVITWTTVGYGDWTPNSSIQLFVSVQALLGYIFMGVIVGLLSAAIHSLGARNADF